MSPLDSTLEVDMRVGGGDLLRQRDARLFLGVTVAAGFGNTAMSVAASVWVLTLTGSGSLAALCGVCVYAPTLLGPLLGALVDRLPRRRVLIGTPLALAALLLSLLAVRSAADIWLIYLVMLGYGLSHVLIDAGESAVIQAVVPPAFLGRLNGLRLSVREGMKLVAPLAGAALVTQAGGRSVVALCVGSLLIGAFLYAAIRSQPRAPKGTGVARPPLLRQTREGLRFLSHHPVLRSVVTIAAVAVAMSGFADAAALTAVTEDLHQTAAFVGVLSAAQGVGAILGGAVGGRLLERIGAVALARWGVVLFAAGVLAICVPWTPAAVAARVLIGVGLPWTVVAAVTAVQRHTCESMIGLVAASASTAIFAPLALTIPAGSALVALLHHRVALVIAAGAALLAVVASASTTAGRRTPVGRWPVRNDDPCDSGAPGSGYGP